MSVTPVGHDPATEIRMTTLHGMRGINFWSKRPVTRMDLVVGAFDDISSADVSGFADRLMAAMPGLIEHQCSIGERGGFAMRLRRGTYAPHIVEHVALELQTMMGHDVGYGRTRGGDTPGEYTLVFEHCHEQVGLRAAALALEVVQRAFTGVLEPGHVAAAVTELAAIAETPDTPALRQRVFCGITGGAGRLECQQELRRRLQATGYEMRSDDRDSPLGADELLIIDLSPGFLMQAGVPYSRSEMAIILDTDISGVADRHRESDHARRLVSLLADAVRTDGMVICPAKEWEIQDYARDEECRVAVFATDDDVTRRDLKVASASGLVRDGHIWVEHFGDPENVGPVNPDLPVAAQVAAALAASVMNTRRRTGDASD